MSKLFTSLLTWSTYSAVLFNVLNPQSIVVPHLENLYILYSVLLTIGFIFGLFMVMILFIANSSIKTNKWTTDTDMEKLRKGINKTKKAFKASYIKRSITSMISIICGTTAFIVLSQFYLGVLMVSSVTLSLILLSQLDELMKTLEEKNVKNT